MGFPMQVAYWVEDVWSYCLAPTNAEKADFRSTVPEEWQEALEFARLEGVSWIDVEGEKVLREFAYSRPKL